MIPATLLAGPGILRATACNSVAGKRAEAGGTGRAHVGLKLSVYEGRSDFGRGGVRRGKAG